MQLHCSVTGSLQARLACWLRREKAARTAIVCSGWRHPDPLPSSPADDPDPCITQEGEAYLARRDVQACSDLVGCLCLGGHALAAHCGHATPPDFAVVGLKYAGRPGPSPRQDALHANRSGSLSWGYKGCTEGEVFKASLEQRRCGVAGHVCTCDWSCRPRVYM